MAFFSKTKEKVDRIERSVQRSFFGVKNEVSELKTDVSFALTDVKQNLYNVGQWLTYFHHKINHQDELLEKLSMEILSKEIVRDEVRKEIDSYYSIKPLIDKVEIIEKRLAELSTRQYSLLEKPEPQQNQIMIQRISELQQKILQLEQRKGTMKERILRNISKTSKEYVKGILLSYIRKYERISAVRLKEMVVEEQGLCSKSSFYRILEEIENEDEVGIIKTKKEKHYFSKLTKKM